MRHTEPHPTTRSGSRRLAFSYTRRRPEDDELHHVVRAELETFLATARRRGRTVPRFVEREFRRYLDCGILDHGFLRLRCDGCRTERLVAFSCKGRGFCPSCGGRRMAETAAHLIDNVLPPVTVRQWVLTLPFALRYRMAYDARLTGEILQVFIRAVFASLRRRARDRHGRRPWHCGAVTFVQRFGDALNLNVHFHTLVLDGVYEQTERGRSRFRPLPPPSDEEVLQVASRVARNLLRLLQRRGLAPEGDPDDVDPLSFEEPWLAALYAASVGGRVASGPRAGQRVRRFGDEMATDQTPDKQVVRRCASVAGVSVHANVALPGRRRRRLERLCRYVARPPLSGKRLSRLPDGRLLYRLRHRWRDGTTHMVYEPQELMERLAALVPPPRIHLVRYHGVLAPAARQRSRVVPEGRQRERARGQGRDGVHPSGRESGRRRDPRAPRPVRPARTVRRGQNGQEGAARPTCPHEPLAPLPPSPGKRRYWIPWSDLMRRVFEADVLECPECGGRLRILSAIHPPETTRAILSCLGLPPRAPPVEPAREPTGPEDPTGSEDQPELDPSIDWIC